jgi:chemotaxis protein CheC
MGKNTTFSEDERDCLQEIMNIAYGSATAAISEILDAFATLKIPKIEIINPSDLKIYLKDSLNRVGEQLITTQLIDGDIAGETLFVMDINSAKNLAREFEGDDENLYDIVLEVSNILSSATLGKFSEELSSEVSFSPPSIQKLESIDQLDNRYVENYQQIIIISTELDFEDQKISGELLILTKDDSIHWIQESINRILEAL